MNGALYPEALYPEIEVVEWLRLMADLAEQKEIVVRLQPYSAAMLRRAADLLDGDR